MKIDLQPFSDAVVPAGDGGQLGFRDIWRFLKQALPFVVVGLILGAIGAFVYLQTATPHYTAKSAVLYDPSKTPRFSGDTPWLEPVVENYVRIESQVEILTSSRLLDRVVHKLNLLDKPEFQLPASYNADVGWQRVHARFVLRENLSVRRVNESSVLTVEFVSEQPETAAQVANALVDEYVVQEQEDDAEAQRRGSEWLEQRLEALRQQVFDARRDVEQFKTVGSGATISESQVQLADLISRSDTFRSLYESFLTRYVETIQRISYPVADAKVISRASTPRTPSSPQVFLVMAFATLLGGVAGAAVAIIRRSLDRRVRSAREAAAETRLDCFRVTRRAEKDPDAFVAAMRPVREALAARFPEASTMAIGFAAADPDVDNTPLTMAAAQLWRRAGVRALVVSAAATPSETGPGDAPLGLADVLNDIKLLDEVIVIEEDTDVATLPMGGLEEGSELSDRVTGAEMTVLFDALRERFDLILVALPMADSIDTRTVSRGLDGVFVTARADKTPVEALRNATKSLSGRDVAVIGAVMFNAPRDE
ncbi:MAG: Wzz/FepE/Etk N-terminal domain-containing protein [Pseudomonadota bacterium]